MSDSRPLLLIDVDGVLNPHAAFECPDGYHEHELFPGQQVLLCAAHGPWLISLGEVFELTWATGWEHYANRLISPALGLPELPVIEFPRDPFVKLPAVMAAVRDRACAWIDDQHWPAHHEWAQRRGAPTLLIEIDPRRGLEASIIDRLRAWADMLTGLPS